MKTTARTHVGLVRPTNQDSLLMGKGFFGVADGMGGHKGGETASTLAAENISRYLRFRKPGEQELRDAFTSANRRIYDMSMRTTELEGMGTTATVLWEDTKQQRMLIGHVGDSRAYRLHNGLLLQETTDHSWVAEMVARGLIDQKDASSHPYRNIITRAIGTKPGLLTDVYSVPLCEGDVWLVCSDGLYGMIPDEDMLQILINRQNDEDAAEQLLQAALGAGGNDNVSFILATVKEVTA